MKGGEKTVATKQQTFFDDKEEYIVRHKFKALLLRQVSRFPVLFQRRHCAELSPSLEGSLHDANKRASYQSHQSSTVVQSQDSVQQPLQA